MKVALLDQLLAAIETERPVVLATDLGTFEHRLLHRDQGESTMERDTVERALREDRCIHVDRDGGATVFYQPFNPPLRMVLIGAVHVAQPLSRMAALTGYAVTIIDPRESFGAPDRFPGVAVRHDWPDAALEALAPDSRTAVVTLTHDPKLDDPALQVALRTEAFFIGSLGSRKTHASRLQRLRNAGFSEEQLARIHGPVGLPIGSRSPAEIAVSVLAQVTETLRKPPRQS